MSSHTHGNTEKNIIFRGEMTKIVPSLAKIKTSALVNKIERLRTLQKTLSRNRKKEELEAILSDDFDYKDMTCASKLKNNKEPECEVHDRGTKRKGPPTSGTQVVKRNLKRDFPLTPTKIALGAELHAANEENEELKKSLGKQRKLTPSKVGQQIKRKQTIINRYKVQLKKLRNQNRKLAHAIKKSRNAMAAKQKTKTANSGIQCSLEKRDVTNLKAEMRSFEDKVLTLEERLSEINEVILTRSKEQGRPFLPEVRSLCHNYLAAGVTADRIPGLIRTTLSLAGREIDDLPSHALLYDLTGEVVELSRQQIGEILSEECDTTLQRDATTKKGHHVQGLLVRTKDCTTYTLGLREVPTGTAA